MINALSVITWWLFVPDLKTAKILELGWVTQIVARNLALLMLVAGGLQGQFQKFDPPQNA